MGRGRRGGCRHPDGAGDGLSFGEAVGRINWHQTAAAVRDGAILGALTGATGGAAAGLGLGVAATATVAIGSDVVFGTANDRIVYGENLSNAFERNLVFGLRALGLVRRLDGRRGTGRGHRAGGRSCRRLITISHVSVIMFSINGCMQFIHHFKGGYKAQMWSLMSC